MSSKVKRVVAVVVAGMFAAATGVVTNMLTDSPSGAWWTALIVLVLAGAVPQIYLNGEASPDDRSASVRATGAGAVAVGGSSHEWISTKVVGGAGATGQSAGQATTAAGAGAVAVGAEARGPIETDVANRSGQAS